MENPKPEARPHRGLSPSSLSLFQGCPRRYFHKKVAVTKPDDDFDDDVESLNIGKAFHKCLEDTKHVLDGYTFAQVVEVAKAHGLTEFTHAPLLMAMLGKYKRMHERSGLRAVAFEVLIETEAFYGIVDVVLVDASGNWWIGDMKTSASYRPDLVPTLPMHPQLNLYAAHVKELAEKLELNPVRYVGCRYRLTTKSKLKRADEEGTNEYIKRLAKAVKSIDFILPKEVMRPKVIQAIHLAAGKTIEKAKTDEKKFERNYANCFSYFRPCEFFSKCHGKQFSHLLELDSVTSD